MWRLRCDEEIYALLKGEDISKIIKSQIEKCRTCQKKRGT
jgi:hypothetical protein